MIPSSHNGVLGARSPQRQPLPRITRPVTALLPTVAPAPQPAVQDAAWRQRARELAWKADWQSQARLERQFSGGVEWYAVPSGSHGHRTYHVIFTPHADAQTVADGVYVCSCIAALRGQPCRHAGAALMLAQLLAEARDSIALMRAEHMSWAWATHDGWSESADHLAWFRVGESVQRQWRTVRVIWDTTRDVAVWCDCGRTVCPHIGAVAQRVDKERRDAERMRARGYGPDWNDALLWDGSVLPAALV